MLATPPDDHTADRVVSLEKGTVGKLLLAIPWNQVLNHYFAQAYVRGCPPKEVSQLSPVVHSPRLGFHGVDEALFYGWLKGEGKFVRNLLEIACTLQIPRSRRGDPQFVCQTVGIPLVPQPLHRFPLGGGDAIAFGEH